MSRLRRLVLSDRFLFLTCNLRRTRRQLSKGDFDCLARVIAARWRVHGFLLTAWVLLPDHWHAIIFPPHPLTISQIMEAIKVGSTRRLNTRRKGGGEIWQPRFFDHALRTVEKYHQCVVYMHLNPVRRGLVEKPEDWKRSSHTNFALDRAIVRECPMQIDYVRLPEEYRG